MSLTPKEDRPKLKAKPFNRFKPSLLTSNIKLTETTDLRRGNKRTRSDGYEQVPVKQKRTCIPSNVIMPPSNTKNLANNRLKNLKQSLQEDLESKSLFNNKQPTTVSTLRESGETRNYLEETPDNKKTSSNLKNVYEKSQNCNISTDNILNRDRRKSNLANDRLQNIKKRLSDSNNCTNTSSVSSESETSKLNIFDLDNSQYSCVKINENKLTTSLKRNIEVADINSRNVYENNLLSKRSAITENVPARSISNRIVFSKHNTPVSQRHLIDKDVNNYSENSYTKKKIKSHTFESTPISQRLSNVRTPNVNSPLEQRVSKDTELKTRNFPSPSLGARNDSFSSKMAMTASWITINHQDLNNPTNNSLESNNTSSNNNITHNENLNSDFANETEDMEWANAEPDDEVLDTNKNIDTNNEEKKTVIKDPDKSKDVCIVVDTNIFISGISKIRDIMGLKTGLFKPVIYVPWMVITELDYMKDSCSDGKLKKNVTNSINFINETLKEKNPKFEGQTIYDMERQKCIGSSPDDKILSCCLQVAERYENVILLSNDVNLKNKAMINNVIACSSNEIIMKIMSKLAKCTKSKKIMHKMGVLCSSVICECVKAAYGNAWTKMDMLSCPPWSLLECLKRFKKYWNSVFREKLMKQFTKTMDSLYYLLDSNKFICDDSEEFVEFMKLCVTICIFLKDIEECRGFVENTLFEITKLG